MSDISSLLNITSDSIRNVVNSGTSKIGGNGDSSAFDGIYNAAVNMITETNDYIHEAEQAEVDFDCISLFPEDAVCGLFSKELAEKLKTMSVNSGRLED